jgi:hypothetical protein
LFIKIVYLTIKNADDILRAGNKLKRKCGSKIMKEFFE